MLVAKTYCAYGLVVCSAAELPCRLAASSRSSPVQLKRAPASQFTFARGADARDRWFSRRRLDDGTTYLCWRGLCEFLVSPDGGRIRYRPLENATTESINVYLLGQVLSFSLVARGIDPLHGTVVLIDGGAVVLLGDCGSGKSTLGAALLARGYPIVTDDLVALESQRGRWRVHPGVPRIKLYSSVARRLLGSPVRGVPMNGETSKLVIPLAGHQTVGHRVPLKAVYILSKPDRRRPPVDTARIDRLAGGEAFLEVIRGAFNLLVVDRGRLANQFAFAARLVAGVPVRRLIYPRKFSALSEVCDALLADNRRQLSPVGRSGRNSHYF